MPATQKNNATPEHNEKIVIIKGGNANWFIKQIKVHPNTKVTWHCRLNNISVWFPKENTPLAGGKNEVYGKNGKASAVVGSKKGTYHYCLLVTEDNGDVHLVEGNSPPEMIIQ
jgi:hypothetical protein